MGRAFVDSLLTRQVWFSFFSKRCDRFFAVIVDV
jgi:hypothetical protein